VAESVVKMFEASYENFHLVGFSLGAQIVGLIGRKVIDKSRGKFVIPRVTGLDPGNTPERAKTSFAYLNAGDAAFVDTIHGDTLMFGTANSVGNSSFWVNGGQKQPMCKSQVNFSKFTLLTKRTFSIFIWRKLKSRLFSNLTIMI
jgi:Lipase